MTIAVALALATAFAAPDARAQQHDHTAHSKDTPAPPAVQAPPAEHDHSGMDHAQMDHSRMDHSGMDHAQHGAQDADAQTPRTPIPPITDADRAAAQPPAHAHAHGTHVMSYVLFDRLEGWNEHGGGQAWEAQAWIGTDAHKLWLRSEGEREAGRTHDADVEVLYGRPIARWWDIVVGVRQDTRPGPSRTSAAIGVMGVAPYKFEVEATAYLDGDGRLSAKAEAEYELLLTNRLILQPLVEAQWHARDDRARGIGAGLGKVEAGLRLRYEITRRFAPYVGLVHERRFGGTADLLRDEGESVEETRVVAGVRFWF
jgi:copper resistance protein B